MDVGELFVLFGLRPQGWQEGQNLVRSLASAARRYIGVEAVRSVGALVTHATEAATHLISLSSAMGLSTEATQEWGYVAQQSGSSMQELSVGMSMWIGNLRKYVGGGGSKQFKHDMAELGLSAEQAREALADPAKMNALNLRVADHIKNLGRSGNQAGFGRELFGARAGRAMVADMARGSEGIKELMDRRRQMGEMTGAEATTLRDLGNRVKDIKTSFSALANTLVAQLAPTFLAMADAAVKWIQENRDILSGALRAALVAIATVIQGIASVVSVFADIVRAALGGDDGAIALMIGLAAAISMAVIPALVEMIAAEVAALAPFIAIAAAVALVAFGILKLIKYAPQIGKALGEAWDWAKQKANEFFDWITGLPERALSALAGFGDEVIAAFDKVWETIKQGAEDAFNWVSKKAREIPVLGFIGEKLGQGAGMVANLVSGGEDMSGIDRVVEAPSTGAATAQGATVNVAPSTININVQSVEDAKKAHDTFQADQANNAMRHAVEDVGGVVR